jgi:hypothetical protein
MALVDFQTALGRLIRVPDGTDPLRCLNLQAGERSSIDVLAQSAGFRFSVRAQRSWCEARAAKSAHLTLSMLPDGERRRLLREWVDSGAGTESFHDAEAESFLHFISVRLTDPSPELTLCRLEQATLRANSGKAHFAAPDTSILNNPGCLLRRGRYAGLVNFNIEPHQSLNALQENSPKPFPSTEALAMLFSPGLEALCRAATADEVNLWERLDSAVSARTLLTEGHERNTVDMLLNAGAIEYV